MKPMALFQLDALSSLDNPPYLPSQARIDGTYWILKPHLPFTRERDRPSHHPTTVSKLLQQR